MRLRAQGVPLGLLDDRDYDEITVAAEPGDVLILYSDGVQDQMNLQDQEYGASRLFQVVKSRCGLPPSQIVDAIFADIDAHRESRPVGDDQTLIVIRIV